MVISMPLMTTLAAAAILIAMRSSMRWPWLIAGALLGLGVYSYNGYLMFLVVVAVLFGVVLLIGGDKLKLYAVGAAFPHNRIHCRGSPVDSFWFTPIQSHIPNVSVPHPSSASPSSRLRRLWERGLSISPDAYGTQRPCHCGTQRSTL